MSEIMTTLDNLVSEVQELKKEINKVLSNQNFDLKKNWIDNQDVMFALNISKRTLQNMRDAGTLPYSKVNGKIYYKVSDLEDLLEKNHSMNYKTGKRNGK